MNIVIWCGGMQFDGDTIESKSLGGSETAAYYVAKELVNRGHKVTLFTTTDKESKKDGVMYLPIGVRNDQSPLGENFHFYATNTPHDVMIIQRHPMAFNYKWASKINYLWLHDVPNKEQIGLFNSQMWNINGVLTVSEYHKNLVVDAYQIDPDFVYSIENGVDADLYKSIEFVGDCLKDGVNVDHLKFNMIYSSRPERGLENLVAPGGIMQQLADKKTNHHLYVCAYDNVTPQMVDYYNYLYQCIEQLPNVTNVGALTKTQLASLQLNCNLAVYPTQFEEVSCITAMECMHAGLPMLTTNAGALPETCKDLGTTLIKLKNGKVNISKFVNSLINMGDADLKFAKDRQLKAAKNKTWGGVVTRIDAITTAKLGTASIANKAKQLMRLGDIYALRYLLETSETGASIIRNTVHELGLYDFAFNDNFAEHYEKYYKYEKSRGVNYGPENLTGNTRFEAVSLEVKNMFEKLRESNSEHKMTVVDYGCAHGHYTVNLAKRFPGINFIGIDIAQSNIDKAVSWTLEEGLSNVKFICGAVDVQQRFIKSETQQEAVEQLICADLIIATEVIEHVATPIEHLKILNMYLAESGEMVITTPYGAWEYLSARDHHPWRAHIHHFDYSDLQDIFKGFKDIKLSAIPNGQDPYGEALGSYLTTYTNDELNKFGEIDYDRKIIQTIGRETLTVCMIVKDGEESILKTLNSIKTIADEIVIGIDNATDDTTDFIIDRFAEQNPFITMTVFMIDEATKTGFAEARNKTIEQASGDWIMWIDADEIIDRPELVVKYLRNNQHTGYAIAQHHFSVQPVGVLKTDFPTRLFRNNIGIKFNGVIHEHPEIKMNDGVKFCSKVEHSSIAHYGYQNEAVRRKRFERNLPLMARDRKENPNRLLGKFLWVRDLAQMCLFQLEQTGQPTDDIFKRANEGVNVWRELLDGNHMRYTVDCLEYVSQLNKILSNGKGREFKFKINADIFGQADLNKAREISVFINEKKDADKLFKMLLTESTKILE